MSKAVIVFTSADRTTTTNSAAFTVPHNSDSNGIWLVLDVTAASGTSPTLNCKLQKGVHGVLGSGDNKWVDVTDAAWGEQTTTGTNELIVFPGIAQTDNVSVSDCFPPETMWRVVATIAGTEPSFTFTIGGYYV